MQCIVTWFKSGAHPAYFKEGGPKQNSIPHSGADSENFGGEEEEEEEILN